MKYSLNNDDKKGESLINIGSVYSQFNKNNKLNRDDENQIFCGEFSMNFLNNDLIAVIGKRGSSESGKYCIYICILILMNFIYYIKYYIIFNIDYY